MNSYQLSLKRNHIMEVPSEEDCFSYIITCTIESCNYVPPPHVYPCISPHLHFWLKFPHRYLCLGYKPSLLCLDIRVHKLIKTVATAHYLCHIMTYFIAFLKFCPSNSQRKCRDRALMWHSLVGNGRHM